MEEGKKRVATLVGCNYPGTENELEGCINDVYTMRELLVGRFGFHPADINVLTDAAASSELPTGANIKRAIRHMIDRAEPGDVLFFYFSGHGTLTTVSTPPKYRHHRHKTDEAIVPCDINLITDVDFRLLVNRLPPGVSFTIAADSCYSGGLIDKEKEQIGPHSSSDGGGTGDHQRQGAVRAIPYETVRGYLASVSGLDPQLHIGDHLNFIFGPDASAKYNAGGGDGIDDCGGDDGILLSGCQPNELSKEVHSETGKACGAFTSAVKSVLEANAAPLSNRELVTRVRRLLTWQHPCLYCSDHNAAAPFLLQRHTPPGKAKAMATARA